MQAICIMVLGDLGGGEASPCRILLPGCEVC